MGGLETGNTYRENEFAMQQLPGKRWEVGNGTVPSNCISPPRGVSDHLFVEDLAKSKLLYGDILSSLFFFTPIIPWFFPTPWCHIWFPGTEGTQESKGGAEKWGNGVPRSSPNLKSQHGWDMHPQKTKRAPESHSLGMVLCDGQYHPLLLWAPMLLPFHDYIAPSVQPETRASAPL